MRFKGIFGDTPDPKAETSLNISRLKEIASDSYSYEDIYFTKDLYVDIVFAEKNGVFVFIARNSINMEAEGSVLYEEIYEKLRSVIPCPPDDFYVFFYSEGSAFIVHGEVVEIGNIYTAFENLYDNTRRPYVDNAYINRNGIKEMLEEPETPEEYSLNNDLHGMRYDHEGITFEIDESESFEDTGELKYVRYNIDQATIDRIDKKLSALEGLDRPVDGYKVDKDGNEYILKHTARKLFGIDTGLVGDKMWFPLSEKDPDKVCLLTIFGGCLGLHKFYLGKIGAGLLYLITFGCFGILPAMDLLSQLTGGAYYETVDYSEDGEKLSRNKTRYYIKKPSNKLFAAIGVVISFVIGILLGRYVYAPLLDMISNAMAIKAASLSEDEAKEIIGKADYITHLFRR